MERKLVTIQPPSATDLPGIVRLWEQMQEEFHEGQPLPPAARWEQARAAYRAWLDERFADRHTFMLVGLRDREVVAYLVARLETDPSPAVISPWNTGPMARLLEVYVQPSLRGNGLARRMLEAAAGWMRAAGAEYMDAYVPMSRKKAMVFLAEAGFQLTSSVLRRPL